jgi:Dolichyl-phosphate-mannose-protein mannosyltransferase
VIDKLLLVLLCLLFALAALGCGVLTPLGRGDDENDHLDYALRLAYDPSLPDPRLEHVGQIQHPPLSYAFQAALLRLARAVDADISRQANPEDGDFLGRRTLFNPWGTLADDLKLDREAFGDLEVYPERYRAQYLMRHWIRYGLRAWSLLWGLAAIALTVGALRQATGLDLGSCTFATAALTLTPSFAFNSAMINNDATLHGLCALAAYIALRRWRQARLGETKTMVVLGVILGLALLVKLLAIGVAAFLFFLVLGDRRLSWPRRMGMSSILVGVTTLISGWWHIRQTILMGEPTPAPLHAKLSPWLLRADPLTPFGALDLSGRLVKSFFAVFGQDQFETVPIYYFPIAGLTLLGLGAALLVSLARRKSEAAVAAGLAPPLRAAFLGFAVLLIGFLLANRTHYHVHGRYAFAYITPLALIFLVGAHRLFGPRVRGILAAAALWNSLFLIFSVGVIVANAYSLPLEKLQAEGVVAYFDCGSSHFDQKDAGGLATTPLDALISRPADTYRLASQLTEQAPLHYEFGELDPEKRYRLRLRYPSLRRNEGDLLLPAAAALMADEYLLHEGWTGETREGELSFPLPRSCTADGSLRLAWLTRTPTTPVVACSEIWLEEELLEIRRMPDEGDARSPGKIVFSLHNRSATKRRRGLAAIEEGGRLLALQGPITLAAQSRSELSHEGQGDGTPAGELTLRWIDLESAPFLSRKASALAPRQALVAAELEVPGFEVIRLERAEPGEKIATLHLPAMSSGAWLLALTGGDGKAVADQLLRVRLRGPKGELIESRASQESDLPGALGPWRWRLDLPRDGAWTLAIERSEEEASEKDFLDRILLRPAPSNPRAGWRSSELR